MNHIADAGKMVETIEVSKLLSECARDYEIAAEFSVGRGSIENARLFRKKAEAIRSVIIPSPGAPDEKEA